MTSSTTPGGPVPPPLDGYVSSGKEWLSMSKNTTGSRYIVDANGKPVRLYAMARCQYHAADIEDPGYGGLDGLCKYFKDLGCNSIRLAFVQNVQTNQSVDFIMQCGGYNEAGIKKYIEKYIDPEVQIIISNGMYVILDLHMYPKSYENPSEIGQHAKDHYIPIWRELAKKYKDEPMIAMYELWNEPHPADMGKLPLTAVGTIASGPYKGYDFNSDIRDFYLECAAEIRKYDTKHIMMLSDFNAGWGCAWDDTWAYNPNAADPVYKNVIFSQHASTTQLETDYEFYKKWWNELATKHNIGLMFGEVETGDVYMTRKGMQNFVAMLTETKDTHHYSSALWRPFNFKQENYIDVWRDFARSYATEFNYAK